MLHSHSHQEQSFDYFASFLRQVLRDENQYKSLVVPIIDEARSLAKNEKDFYKISSQCFDVIVYLVGRDKNFFIGLSGEPSSTDYEHILNLLTAQREVSPA